MEKLKVEQCGTWACVQFPGDLTVDNTDRVKSVIGGILDKGLGGLVLDLSQVGFVDSTGVGLLISFSTRLKGEGKGMYLYRPSQQVRKTLTLVQLIRFFHILETEDELIAVMPE